MSKVTLTYKELETWKNRVAMEAFAVIDFDELTTDQHSVEAATARSFEYLPEKHRTCGRTYGRTGRRTYITSA